jgi:hypothetical protein
MWSKKSKQVLGSFSGSVFFELPLLPLNIPTASSSLRPLAEEIPLPHSAIHKTGAFEHSTLCQPELLSQLSEL